MRKNLYMDSEDFDECIDWNPQSNFEEENFHILDYNLQQSDALETDKKRPSHKNKYINKITQIKPESTSTSKRKCFIDYQVSLEPEELKKFKNREAAKESRQRKKLYINIMEEQIKKLEQELQQTNKQIESCKIQIQKSTFNNNQAIGSYDSKLMHVFKKIEKLFQCQESEERNSELNLAIDSIFYRFGATGRQRKNNINQSYKLILLLAFPVIHRYIAWTARERAHIFSNNESFNLDHESWFSEMKRMICDRLQANSPYLQTARGKIANNLQIMQELSAQLKNGKGQIQQICNILDNLFTEIREILTPAQSAKLILLTQKYKYREQLHFLQVAANPPANPIQLNKRAQGQPRKYIKLESVQFQ